MADVKLNGKLTLGENVADNGGVRLAWMALMEMLKTKHARRTPTASRRSSASSSGGGRCGARTARDEIARLHAQTNPHSPGRYRDERRRVEHAGVREGLHLPGHREDGEAAGLPRLVIGREAVRGIRYAESGGPSRIP